MVLFDIKCIRCGEWKRKDDFYPTCLKKSLFWCKECWCAYMRKYKKEHREQFTKIERNYYHKIQDEAGCHMRPRDFYPGYRVLKALQDAEVVRVK